MHLRLLPLLFASLFLAGCDLAPREEAVLHNGRVKPLEAYARYTVKLLTGKETWQKKEAVAWIADARKAPAETAKWPWIRIDLPELKRELGLPEDRLHFSLVELRPKHEEVRALVAGSKKKRDTDARPSKVEQKAELLYIQMYSAEELASGREPQPAKPGKEESAHVLSRSLRMQLETAYLRFKPFEVAAAAYLLAFLLLVAARFRGAGTWAAAGGFFFHTLGLVLRIAILSRPPVSNMYESMVYMNWALMLFALIFFITRREPWVLAAGSLVSALVTLYANLLPLDASLDVLVPVLRSNYWLTIHVLTVVSSYAAFGLAMGLGHRHLWLRAFSRDFPKESQMQSSELMYRIIQLGVVLIGTGTVLGGVWANESWGRFWGWDPKETWALITFLGYLIVVHLKAAKRIGAFGVALAAVLGFELVLMTWYGVNFVLGRGLHSYGAGSGGTEWILYFLAFEALFLLAVLPKALSKRT